MLIALFSVTLKAEYFSNTVSEGEVAEIANNQTYPGGIDEDELSVQEEELEAKQHITAATLQWRAKQVLTRDTAAAKTDNETSD